MIVGYKYSRKYVSAKVAIIKTQLNFSLLQYQLYVLDTLFSVVQIAQGIYSDGVYSYCCQVMDVCPATAQDPAFQLPSEHTERLSACMFKLHIQGIPVTGNFMHQFDPCNMGFAFVQNVLHFTQVSVVIFSPMNIDVRLPSRHSNI